MKTEIAFDSDVAKTSFQDEFPLVTECSSCTGESRLAFVAHEQEEKEGSKYISQLYENEPGGTGYWLHDACCVAVYFCKKCLEPTALYNQA